MTDWWNALSTYETVLWFIAITASLIFVVLLVLTFMGGDLDSDVGDVDADLDADTGIPFQFFTIKNLIAFFSIFGWVALTFEANGASRFMGLSAAIISGLIMMGLMASLFYFMLNMESSGTFSFKNSIGKIGEVYMSIPANRNGLGKVSIKVQGSLRELEAMTDSPEGLTQGTIVEVINVINDNILVVMKNTSEPQIFLNPTAKNSL